MLAAEVWTGDIVARLHVSGISQKELAAKMGIAATYVSSLLNGKRAVAGMYERMMAAIDEIEREKGKEDTRGE